MAFPALSATADSASSVEILPANTARLGAWVFNDSSEILYLGIGNTPTTTSYNIKITAGTLWEMPHPPVQVALNGIWANNSTGSARVTEIT